jgi:hypothetical protein
MNEGMMDRLSPTYRLIKKIVIVIWILLTLWLLYDILKVEFTPESRALRKEMRETRRDGEWTDTPF